MVSVWICIFYIHISMTMYCSLSFTASYQSHDSYWSNMTFLQQPSTFYNIRNITIQLLKCYNWKWDYPQKILLLHVQTKLHWTDSIHYKLEDNCLCLTRQTPYIDYVPDIWNWPLTSTALVIDLWPCAQYLTSKHLTLTNKQSQSSKNRCQTL